MAKFLLFLLASIERFRIESMAPHGRFLDCDRCWPSRSAESISP